MINLIYSLQLNIKKFKKYTTRAMYLVIPITILVALSLLISSSTKNIQEAATQSIFGTIDKQLQLIQLKKDNVFTVGGSSGMVRLDSNESMNYTENDLAVISGFTGVQKASIISAVPVANVTYMDLFNGIKTSISSLTGLEADYAPLFTDSDFSYTEGQPIPVILNSNNFIEQYQDWGGKDEITITIQRGMFRAPGQSGSTTETNPMESAPVKTRAITFDKQSLIGKEFTVSIGGLTELQNYAQEMTEAGIVFTKLTQAEIDTKEANRNEAISPYWDYTKIATALTYTFKVVGVVEDTQNRSTYVPESFANKLMHDYIQNQLDARTTKDLTADVLGTTFTGIDYDGVEITNNTGFGGGMRVAIGRFGGGTGGMRAESGTVNTEQSDSYVIPGLVVQTERNQSAGNPFGEQPDVIGEYTDTTVYENAARSGSTILIKTSDVYGRLQVTDALNSNGYAFADSQKLDVLNKVRDNVKLVSIVFSGAFIAFSILIIIFTMGKFVSESRKEIGIMRAIGATKSDIRNLFITQSLLYTFISYVIGLAGGFLLIYIISHPLASWFDSVVGASLRESFSVVNTVDPSIFNRIDWSAFGIYSIVLLVITIIISIIPAIKASNVSPVEAIKGE